MLRSGVRIIVCELHPTHGLEFGVCFDDLLRVVRENGRTVAYLDGDDTIEDGPTYGAVVIS